MNIATVRDSTRRIWEELATRWHARCIEAQNDGHPERWYRSDLEDELKAVLEETGRSEDRVRSWFDKLSLAALSLEMPFALDMDTVPGPGAKYLWRHDGQMPAGMLAHRANIVRGMSPGMLNLVWKMAASGYDAAELVDGLGESALPCVITARLAAFELYTGEERSAVLAQLTAIESEVAARLDAGEIRAIYDEVFALPALTDGRGGTP